MPVTLAMVWLGALCGVFGFGALAYLLVVSPPRALLSPWRSHHRHLHDTLQFLRASLTATQVVGAQLANTGCMLAIAAWSGGWWMPTMLVVAGWSVPRHWLQRARNERVACIEAQLDTWLLLLAHALKATPALGEAMASTTALLGGALGQELAVALHEHALGSPLKVAISAMAKRVGSPVLSMAATTLDIAHRTGGDLSETLERSAASLREMARLEGVVRTKTAEGRSQAWVVSCVPAVVLFTLWKMSPEIVQVLFVTTRGHAVLVIACVMWVAAIASAVRILQVDI